MNPRMFRRPIIALFLIFSALGLGLFELNRSADAHGGQECLASRHFALATYSHDGVFTRMVLLTDTQAAAQVPKYGKRDVI